jgi:hypothetical protein
LFDLFFQGELIEKIQVDVDGFIMQIFIIDPRLADPISSLCLQKVAEDITKCLVADYFLYQIIVVFLTLQ